LDPARVAAADAANVVGLPRRAVLAGIRRRMVNARHARRELRRPCVRPRREPAWPRAPPPGGRRGRALARRPFHCSSNAHRGEKRRDEEHWLKLLSLARPSVAPVSNPRHRLPPLERRRGRAGPSYPARHGMPFAGCAPGPAIASLLDPRPSAPRHAFNRPRPVQNESTSARLWGCRRDSNAARCCRTRMNLHNMVRCPAAWCFAEKKLLPAVRGGVQVERVFGAHRDVNLSRQARTQPLPIALQQLQSDHSDRASLHRGRFANFDMPRLALSITGRAIPLLPFPVIGMQFEEVDHRRGERFRRR